MVITVTCPSCSSSFPVDPAKIPKGGVNARCSSCGDVFRIEKPAEAAPAISEAPPMAAPAPVSAPAPPVAPAPPPVPSVPTPPPLPDPVPVSAPPSLPEVTPLPEPVAQEDDWVIEKEEAPGMENASFSTGSGAPKVSDPFAEPAPFEHAAAEVAKPLPAPPQPPAAPPMPPTPPAPAPAEPAGGTISGFTFGKRDPTDKARRLARVLVSDMIMYNAERHQSALAEGTLERDFEDEIDKSWKEYVDQVGRDLANGAGRQFWIDALNDILAKGEQVF